MESTEEWIRRIGSQEAYDDRIRRRLAGTLNAPLRGKRGLANVVQAMSGLAPHPLLCRCDECIPSWLKEEMKSWPVIQKGQFNAVPSEPKKVTKIKHKEGKPSRRKSRWSQRGNSSN